MGHGRIVVGVDEFGHGREAARFALTEAHRRHADVIAVCAIPPAQTWVEGYDGPAVAISPNLDDASRAAETRIRGLMLDVARSLGDGATEVPVHIRAVAEAPVPALLDRTWDADLLVVGHRPRGGATAAISRSVGLQCAQRASCPVVIVPEQTSATGHPQVTAR